MTETDIDTFVRAKVAAYLKIPFEQVTPSSNLGDLGMDSLGALELILTCEEEFGLSLALDREEVEIVTVADAIAYVARRVLPDSGLAESSVAQ